MARFRITAANRLGHEVGAVVQVPDTNVGIWAARPWAERVRGKQEAAVKKPPENAALRTGKIEVRHKGGGWYAVLDNGDEVDVVQGREEAEKRRHELEAE